MPLVTVIIPVYNEAGSIAKTLQAAGAAIETSGFDGQLLVVDDGSTDGTGDAARKALPGLPVRVISQPNQGRLAARRRGLEAVADGYVLFLDSRVTLAPGSLRFVREQLEAGKLVWNAHVEIEAAGNPYGSFWTVLTELAFSSYFAQPRTTSYTAADFDAYPKGTTCFFAPAELIKTAFSRFRTRYRDERHANDDTPILRWLAGQLPINISPEFSCTYEPRRTFQGFIRHAFHRGIVFLDGHGRPDSAYFPAVIAFYPATLLWLALTFKRPRIGAGLVAGSGAAAGLTALARGYPPPLALNFAALAPVYVLAHGAGMWRGLQLLLANRVGRQPE